MTHCDGCRNIGILAEISVDELHIGTAHSAGLHIDENLVRLDIGYRYVLEDHGFAVLMHACCFHICSPSKHWFTIQVACLASSSVRLVYVRGIPAHLNVDRCLNGLVWLSLRLHPRRIRLCLLFVTRPCVESLCTQAFSIQTVCAFTKACAPKCESSRPYPLFLTPPTGTRGSDAVTPLMNTPPV